MPCCRLSIVLATHNRRDVLAHTLGRLAALELDHGEYEVIVVDNASSEDVAAVVGARRNARILKLDYNAGPCAKAFGVAEARGAFVLFLDDDSYPRDGHVSRMLAHFARDPQLGCAAFTVHLPDGSQECCALPHVFVGCGAGFRAAALRATGGLDASFFMAAEEYDLSFRLLKAGWGVEVFGDLAVEHLKTAQARRPARTTYYDVVNNARVMARYLPQPYFGIYWQDWLRRYRWLSAAQGHGSAFWRGLARGNWQVWRERGRYAPWRLDAAACELVFCWDYVARCMAGLREAGARRVLLADLGKNAYAFWRGAHEAGLEIVAIADDRLARPGRRYRGVSLLPLVEALRQPADAIVVSNTSYVHATRRAEQLRALDLVPVHNWFPPPAVGESTAASADLAPASVSG